MQIISRRPTCTCLKSTVQRSNEDKDVQRKREVDE